jgi:hypothetical protein
MLGGKKNISIFFKPLIVFGWARQLSISKKSFLLSIFYIKLSNLLLEENPSHPCSFVSMILAIHTIQVHILKTSWFNMLANYHKRILS